MAEVITRPEARADMLDIYVRSIMQYGIAGADAYLDGIGVALEGPSNFPQFGPILPGIRPQVRYLTYKRHRIIYDYDGSTVWIVRVLHHAMDVRRLM